MYTILNPIEDLLLRANIKIKKYDRSKYFIYFSTIEKYISDNKLIVGGNFANLLILDNKDDIKNEINITYEIYSEEPKEDAIELAKLIFESDKNGIARYVNIITKIPNEIYNININGRLYCIFNKLPVYKGVQIESLLNCQTFNAIYNKHLEFLCMGNFVQLIDLYKNINNPNNASDWEQYLIDEKKIRNLYIKNLKHDTTHEETTFLNLSFIYDEYICNSDNILISNYFLEENLYKNGKIQIITSKDLENEGKKLTILCNKNNLDITWTINKINYLNDIYLKKLTLIASINGEKINIMDIFNYGEYNLVGYHIKTFDKKNIKYGSIFILMLFNLISIWISNLSKKENINEINAEYIKLSDQLNNLDLTNASNFEQYISTIEYLGIYKDPDTEFKRRSFKLKRQNNQNTVSIYYPLNFNNKHKLLSDIV